MEQREACGVCNFEVDLGGQIVGFSSVSAPGVELARSADAVRVSVVDVTLRRCLTGDLTVWSWVRRNLDRPDDLPTVTITLLDTNRVPVCNWELRRLRPVAWRGPDLDSLATGSVAMEHLVIAAEEFELNV